VLFRRWFGGGARSGGVWFLACCTFRWLWWCCSGSVLFAQQMWLRDRWVFGCLGDGAALSVAVSGCLVVVVGGDEGI
jgi:hypothetical protein